MYSKSIPVWLIVVLALLLWGGEAGRRDLWEPDEARFALIAGEMRDGHWLVPYRQGEFYAHKPPLMFWLINAGSLVTGGSIGNLAPRLPSLLGAVMALVAAARLSERWFSRRAGWMTVALLMTSFLFWNKGGFGQIDMLLCGLSMAALYAFFTADQGRRTARLAVAYACMGLGILAKGPVGFLVPWGVYIAATLLSGEHGPSRRWRHLLWGPLITLAFPAAWLLLAAWQGAPAGYFDELLFKQSVGRVTGEFGGHVRPFYYFLKYFPIDFLPWTLLLPLAWHVLRRVPMADCPRNKLLVWIVFVILFFTLSTSKRNLYILLAYPAAAMLVAGATDHLTVASPVWLRRTRFTLLALMALLGAGMLVAPLLPSLPFDARTVIPGGLALLAGAYWVGRTGRAAPTSPRWIAAACLATGVAFATTGALVYPALDDAKTPDELAEVAREHLGPDDRVVMYRMHGEIFSLYTGRKGLMAFDDDTVRHFLRTAPQPRHLIIALARDADAVRDLLGNRVEPVPFTSGSKELVWFAWPPDAGQAKGRRTDSSAPPSDAL